MLERLRNYFSRRRYRPVANVALTYRAYSNLHSDVGTKMKGLEGIKVLLTDGFRYFVSSQLPSIPNLKMIKGHFTDTPENVKYAMGFRKMPITVGFDVYVMYYAGEIDIPHLTEVFIDGSKELKIPETIAQFI